MSLEPNLGNRRSFDAGFPKKYRLTKTDEFSSVFGFRKAVKGTYFLLHYRPRLAEEDQVPRLGLVVAKRLLKRAVDRNLVRRLAREQFRLRKGSLPARDFILRLVTKPGRKPDRQVLVGEMKRLFDKIISRR